MNEWMSKNNLNHKFRSVDFDPSRSQISLTNSDETWYGWLCPGLIHIRTLVGVVQCDWIKYSGSISWWRVTLTFATTQEFLSYSNKPKLDLDLKVFLTYTVHCISCTGILATCIYGCTCTTAPAALPQELEILSSIPLSSFLVQPCSIGLETWGCCWKLSVQITAW